MSDDDPQGDPPEQILQDAARNVRHYDQVLPTLRILLKATDEHLVGCDRPPCPGGRVWYAITSMDLDEIRGLLAATLMAIAKGELVKPSRR